ncbi:MAG: nitrogen fixation protein NifH [Chloroflexota bacterium]|nr:nitrogen fixation protein NifH [Chloroflexota bacterium]
MANWKSILKADPTEWLLEKNNPSARYLTLTTILDMPLDALEVQEAKAAIMETGIVPKVLANQEEGGYWDEPDKLYTAKYKGTVWQLIILADLLADGTDESIKNACEFVMKNSQDQESYGFSMRRSVKMGGGRHHDVIPCLTGNMVWSLIRLGYLHDPRVQQGIQWITTYQRFDDGIGDRPRGWPYDKAEPCWGKHSCHMGAAKSLKALAEIPVAHRSETVERTIQEGIEYFLKHHVHKQSHDLTKVSKPGWLRFGFPLMYQTDILEILDILTQLGCRDERMQEAVDIVISKQGDSGKWILASTFNGRFQANIEEKGKPSKWITLRALRVLKRYYG